MTKKVAIPFWLFVGFWFASLLLPFGAHVLLPLAGILLGIILPVLWLTRMPTSCLGGAFIAFPMAITQIAFGLGWLVQGIRLLMR